MASIQGPSHPLFQFSNTHTHTQAKQVLYYCCVVVVQVCSITFVFFLLHELSHRLVDLSVEVEVEVEVVALV